MATTKKTTTKTTTKKTTKPNLTVVKDEAVKEQSVFEIMAEKNAPKMTDVDLGDGAVVNVRERISLNEMMVLCKNITDALINEDKGEVNFEAFDFTQALFITSFYCGIPAPKDLSIGYDAVCGTNGMYAKIVDHIDQSQLQQVKNAVWMILRSRQEMYNSAAAKITIDMLQRVNELYDMISGVTENFDGEEAVDAIKKLVTLTGVK